MQLNVLGDSFDGRVRASAFAQLRRWTDDGRLPATWQQLLNGLVVDGQRITLIGQKGIWKPGPLALPISIATSPKDPYGDQIDEQTGTLQYAYETGKGGEYRNDWLRQVKDLGLPLIYLRGVRKGEYSAIWPVWIVADDPAERTFTVAFGDPQLLDPDPDSIDLGARRYTARLAKTRLHQADFRARVMTAYRNSCTVCSLHLKNSNQLLDAAHIIPDSAGGEPVVTNGLSMCKIHHTAYDSGVLGIDPALEVHINPEILEQRDGPMLRHGLQELHGQQLAVVPHKPLERPDRAALELRYDEFRTSSAGACLLPARDAPRS
ncbi:MAG: HNH endonuclease [Actinomycetota bacterium]